MKKNLFFTVVFLLSALCANAQKELAVDNQYPGDVSARNAFMTALDKQSNPKTSALRTTFMANKPSSNWFISLEGGLNHLMSEGYSDYPFEKNLHPTGGLVVGKWFSPVWGLRLGVSGGPLLGYMTPTNNGGGIWYVHKGDLHYTTSNVAAAYIPTEVKDNHAYQKFSYADATMSFMVNLKNLFRPYNPKGFFNPVFYGGFGWARTFGSDFDPLGTYKDINGEVAPIDNLVGKAGLQFNFRLCDAWDLYLAAEGMMAPENFDRYIGSIDTYEGVASVKLGFTYHFPYRHFIKAPLYDQNEVDALNREINDLRNRKPADCPPPVVCPPVKDCPEAAKPAEVTNDLDPVFFLLNSYVVRDNQLVSVAKAAEYMNSHPNAKLELASYADKKTGNPSYNLQLSKKRTDAVANVLVNKFGIDKKRLILKHYGDTVQPFKENDWNRVTIFIRP